MKKILMMFTFIACVLTVADRGRSLTYNLCHLVLGKYHARFHYLYKSLTQIDEIHLTFQMGSPSYNLQANLKENWLDVLLFISPPPVRLETYGDLLQTVNYVNWYVKSAGRFYVDSYGDLAYNVQLNFNHLLNDSLQMAQEIEVADDYYSDLFPICIQVCESELTFQEAKVVVDELFGEGNSKE